MAETTGLLNRHTLKGVSGVRIPLSPQKEKSPHSWAFSLMSDLFFLLSDFIGDALLIHTSGVISTFRVYGCCLANGGKHSYLAAVKINDQTSGILFALVGTLLFSMKAIFVKLSYLEGIDTLSLLLLRMVFALPFYLFVISRLWRSNVKKWRSISTKHWISLAVAAILGYYLSSFLDFMGLRFIDASVERLILFIYPTFIAIISFLAFGERVSRLQFGALALSYVGLFFVFGHNLGDLSMTSTFWKGAMLICACAVTFALFMVMSQWLIPIFGATSFTSISMTIACFFVIGHFLTVHEVRGILSHTTNVYVYALAMATIATVIPSYIVNYAIQRIGATRAAILASVGPISTISLAYLLLGERLLPIQIVGALLIIVGVTIVSVEVKRKAKKEKLGISKLN